MKKTGENVVRIEAEALRAGCGFGAQLEADTRPIRFLLERGESFQRSRVAGALLLLPA